MVGVTYFVVGGVEALAAAAVGLTLNAVVSLANIAWSSRSGPPGAETAGWAAFVRPAASMIVAVVVVVAVLMAGAPTEDPESDVDFLVASPTTTAGASPSPEPTVAGAVETPTPIPLGCTWGRRAPT